MTGFRLGDSEGPSQHVRGTPALKTQEKVELLVVDGWDGGDFSSSKVFFTHQVHHVLTFYANGFTVDDGPLRNGDSEEDRRFLASVSKG